MIKPYPTLITNEKDLQKFAKPFEIDNPIYFFKDIWGISIVIFNLKNHDDKDLILSKNDEIYQGEKIYIQHSIYKIPI
jgi:hypothetical protein